MDSVVADGNIACKSGGDALAGAIGRSTLWTVGVALTGFAGAVSGARLAAITGFAGLEITSGGKDGEFVLDEVSIGASDMEGATGGAVGEAIVETGRESGSGVDRMLEDENEVGSTDLFTGEAATIYEDIVGSFSGGAAASVGLGGVTRAVVGLGFGETISTEDGTSSGAVGDAVATARCFFAGARGGGGTKATAGAGGVAGVDSMIVVGTNAGGDV